MNQFIKYPDCDNPPENLALDSDAIGFYSWIPEKFPTQLFLILDFKEDSLEINRFLNKGISKEYVEVWKKTPQIPEVKPITKGY